MTNGAGMNKEYELYSFCPPPGNDKDKTSYIYCIQLNGKAVQTIEMNPEQFEQFYLDVKAMYENPRKHTWREL